jgi:O-antigen ligase
MKKLGSDSKKLENYFSSCALFLCGFLTVLIPSGYFISYAFSSCLGLFFCFKNPTDFWYFFKKFKLIWISFTIFFFTQIATAYLHNDHLARLIDSESRYLAAPFIAFTAYKCKSSVKVFLYAICIGLAGLFLCALFQKILLGYERASGFTNPIQYGNLALFLSIACFSFYGIAKSLKEKKLILSLLIAGTLGIITSFLSISKGGWISIPIFTALLIYYYYKKDFISKKNIFIILMSLSALISLLFSIPQTKIYGRLYEANIALRSNFTEDYSDNSTSIRWYLFLSAIEMIKEKPLLGWGIGGYFEKKQSWVLEKKYPEYIKRYTHPHNEILNVWVKGGLVFLLALLCLYLYPFAFFYRSYKKNYIGIEEKYLAFFGMLIPVVFFLFGLSQCFLLHNSSRLTFITFISLSAGLIIRNSSDLIKEPISI